VDPASDARRALSSSPSRCSAHPSRGRGGDRPRRARPRRPDQLTTTGAVSYGRSLDLPFGRLALGATGKYIVGNALVHGQDAGSFLSANASQISVDFPLIVSDTGGGNTSANHGHGIGLDLGAAWQSGPLTAGLALQNIVNTFRWDASSMYYKPMSAYYGADTSYSQSSGALPIETATGPERSEPSNRALAVISSAMAGTRKIIIGLSFSTTSNQRSTSKRGM